MTSTVALSTLSSTISAMMSTTSETKTTSNSSKVTEEYHPVLLVINIVVLLSGTISLSLTMHTLKSASSSTTSIAVLNLIFAHFIFLVTVPFRIYYYVIGEWKLGLGWCKVVSSMIHIHMYMSFIFYVIILIMRLLTFYHKAAQLASFQRIHALLISAVVWIVVLVTVPCIIHFSYGKNSEMNSTTENKTRCFNFGDSIESSAVVVNYIISILIVVVATALTAFQANVLRVLRKKHHQGCTSQQDFGAQVKSMCFALIMVVCFIPYHMFRFHYLEHIQSLQGINEVFLSLTTFNCLDMLTFLGRRNCYMCFFGKTI
ncbi:probable G-protein coupled receptor 141 [Lates calcarifer]|uniref:Probable G-protein coupled receptor 141 n=1 Tax=Lates calcarifer TaxID=8187 RepID=A0AAJ7QJ42_LATCA|nr:probable G-protein coupled receptor 141 [Lates calcarifer]